MLRLVCLLYDDVESLDVVGPYDVFSMANVVNGSPLFLLTTVSENSGLIRCLGGLGITADHQIGSLQLGGDDILLVPGAPPSVIGQFPKRYPATVRWLQTQSPRCRVVASVCFGALILGQSQLLARHRVTTHHQALAALKQIEPNAQIIPGARYVDARPEANIASSAGVSSGIDLAFYLLRELAGDAVAVRTSQIMEYNHTTNFAPR
ncbi:DJ-1/PfpI family protein [Lacunimicrobium album]